MTVMVLLELRKIFSKWRTYIGFIAIAVLTIIVQVSLYLTGDNYIKFLTRNLAGSFTLYGDLFNGYLVANLVLGGLFIHIPFLIVLVGGDLMAGEATGGTYRMLLTRPVSRFQVVTSKFIAGCIYTILLLVWLAVLSLGVSILLFGTGELIAFHGKIIVFASNDVLWRFLCAYSFAALSMITVLAVSFLFSSLVENAIGPIVVTMALIIIFLVLSAIPVDFLQSLRPYFFTTHMVVWDSFFSDPIDYEALTRSGGILLLHIAGLYLASVFIFIKKDILS
jgi:ABC-2 type transport system permease protein